MNKKLKRTAFEIEIYGSPCLPLNNIIILRNKVRIARYKLTILTFFSQKFISRNCDFFSQDMQYQSFFPSELDFITCYFKFISHNSKKKRSKSINSVIAIKSELHLFIWSF